MIVNKEHYRKMIIRQSFDTENTLFNDKIIDSKPFSIDLGVYDV